MKHEILSGSNISAHVARGMALAFFARAFSELSGLLEPHGGAKLPDDIDPAAQHAAFTLACDLRVKNDVADLEQLYQRAQDVRKTGEGSTDMTPALFGAYLAIQSNGGGTALADAFGEHVADRINVPHVEFGAHSLERDYSV